MKIVFSDHAELKIRQRKLSRQKILETVEHPDFIRESYNGREEWFKDFGKNHLKVIVIIGDEILTIITAHWIAGNRLK